MDPDWRVIAGVVSPEGDVIDRGWGCVHRRKVPVVMSAFSGLVAAVMVALWVLLARMP
ncbi:hypothetical protein [Nocardia sp. NPDC047654]|uniref:hypothetical protein n=1 Tax=Nocardia sp. NPDC047654 TaxID=3364314 RepID=UPI00371DBB7E